MVICSELLRIVRICVELNCEWEASGSIDWQEAEDLHKLLSEFLSNTSRQRSAELMEIATYGERESEWDSEYVGNWPALILVALVGSEKHYSYRETDNDSWEVLSTLIDSGEEEWVGTVETESIAIRLCTALYIPWP